MATNPFLKDLPTLNRDNFSKVVDPPGPPPSSSVTAAGRRETEHRHHDHHYNHHQHHHNLLQVPPRRLRFPVYVPTKDFPSREITAAENSHVLLRYMYQKVETLTGSQAKVKVSRIR